MSRLFNLHKLSPRIDMLLNRDISKAILQKTRLLCNQTLVTEEQIRGILRKTFPSSQTIQVEDVSGGCGAMFNIYIESSEFKGLTIPKQHKIVYASLKDQIKNIHGLHLETKVPS